jgi:hypothetical protein
MRKRSDFPVVATVAVLTFLATGDGPADSRPDPLPRLPLSLEQKDSGYVAHGEGYGIALINLPNGPNRLRNQIQEKDHAKAF